MIYEWKDGSQITISAEDAGARLSELRTRHGELTAEIVVEDARSRRSPLHAAFEWDDTAAAHAYRLDQARLILRCLVVTYDDAKTTAPIRAFVTVEREGGRSYESTIVAMSDAELRQQVLDRASRELDQWRARYEQLEEFAGVVAAHNSFKKSHKRRRAA